MLMTLMFLAGLRMLHLLLLGYLAKMLVTILLHVVDVMTQPLTEVTGGLEAWAWAPLRVPKRLQALLTLLIRYAFLL